MKQNHQTTTVWITGDQCSMSNTALAAVDKRRAQVLMIESVARGNQLRYHKKKLVLIYSVMRHFAQELSAAGWQVDYYQESPDFQGALRTHLDRFRPAKFAMMEQSEFGATDKLRALLDPLPVEVTRHCNFISNAEEFEKLHRTSESRLTMETFYRLMRRKTGILMDGDQPMGGTWNFDKSNRQPPGETVAHHPIKQFPPDKVTQDVIAMVERHFGDHPGTTGGWIYAVSRQQALEAADDFFRHRLDQFGPHQDAMVAGEPFLNHSVLSPYINTCLLHPLELCREAETRYLSKQARLTSVEGFVRQLIGWREFIWRVYWRLMDEYKSRNSLSANEPLPDFFWTGDTRMNCLRDAISTVLEHGYAHHIIRLMVLGNFSLIAGLDPIATNDWFASMFVDGYDWVMVPNVIGMSLHADGGYVGTKPYAASANYINRMSNYCSNCYYSPKETFGQQACPFNALYWDFLLRHEGRFSKNNRMAMIMSSMKIKDQKWKSDIRKRASELRQNGWI